MRYDTRNRKTIEELAPNTKAVVKKWYQYCVDNKVNILIYEARRTKAEQRENVRRGVSKTMKSYHLVGQAIDFVPVDSKGNALWSLSAYKKEPYKSAIAYAKKLGLEWGGDWTSFVDAPHLQYNYKGYGTDKKLTVNVSNPTPTKPTASSTSDKTAIVPYPGIIKRGSKGKDVQRIQRAVGVYPDGIFGANTEKMVKNYQARKGLKADGIVGPNTWYMMF